MYLDTMSIKLHRCLTKRPHGPKQLGEIIPPRMYSCYLLHVTRDAPFSLLAGVSPAAFWRVRLPARIMQSPAALPYHEPGIVTILVQSSFLLLLNILNHVLDRLLCCGLLGQILVGIAWGAPAAKWLGGQVEAAVVQLGYLGLLLIVYQGPSSPAPRPPWLPTDPRPSRRLFDVPGAFPGQHAPVRGRRRHGHRPPDLLGATPLQCFAAGAALCSTSLGTTFTVLDSSGLIKSRLGVVLTSAAIMDDVVGLVMVQVVSNLGQSGASFTAVTVVRPLLVSLAFALLVPVTCLYVARPVTRRLGAWRVKHPVGLLNAALEASGAAFAIHLLVLLGCVAAATYAGTSNLLAAYTAGAAVSWWDSEAAICRSKGPSQIVQAVDAVTASTRHPANAKEHDPVEPQGSNGTTPTSRPPTKTEASPCRSGLEVYDDFFAVLVDRILRPFFFVRRRWLASCRGRHLSLRRRLPSASRFPSPTCSPARLSGRAWCTQS